MYLWVYCTYRTTLTYRTQAVHSYVMPPSVLVDRHQYTEDVKPDSMTDPPIRTITTSVHDVRLCDASVVAGESVEVV